ncbi:zinc finger BED domain-containing protein RICESLEEPER 3-like [Arachis hypogaea]|uniref:zinc finger BED domain-containing protein RICESLEEPER 3-like n=1 Tax=Arachis hypogaea TaxID=3818 RepID=UPI003B225519
MAEKMKSKYDKYWGNIKNTNMMIFIAVVLDPRYKLQLIKWSFEKLYEKEDAEFLTSKVKDTLFKVFDSYRLFGGNYQRSTRQDPPEISTHKLEAHKTSFAMEFEKKMQFNESANKNEIARDVLAMPVFTIASESAFSTGGRVLNNYRSSLTPMTTEALICTQNWLRNSPKLVLEELIEELEKLELEVAPTPDPNEEDSGVECD